MMGKKNRNLAEILEPVRLQNYPLKLTYDQAKALVECMQKIMDELPKSQQRFVQAYYDCATSALCHPESAQQQEKGEPHG